MVQQYMLTDIDLPKLASATGTLFGDHGTWKRSAFAESHSEEAHHCIIPAASYRSGHEAFRRSEEFFEYDRLCTQS